MIFRKLVLANFSGLRRGAMVLTLPDGTQRHFGGLSKELVVQIQVSSENFFRRCVLHGPIGFAESYMAGEWDTPDLTLLLSWFILNAEDSQGLKTRQGRSTGLLNLLNAVNRLRHLQRPNSLSKSRKNISEHYDLSNDFFKLWLDPSMTYSSAFFESPGTSLEMAQQKKYAKLCEKLRITATDHVLEIGSGWGGFSIHAATHHGCRVTTITISEEQFAEAGARIRIAGLSDKVEILLTDYRTLQGKFDKIVSIEMLEAVGERYVDGYFAKCQALLKPHGLLGLQMILCPDNQYSILRDGVDFIQKHIFPGSLLMSNSRIAQAMNATGDLNLYHYEDMAPHYARTLALWRWNFEHEIDKVRALGFDESFLRKWRYYLCYCEAAFGTRHITVAQAVYSRPDNIALDSPIHPLIPVKNPER